MRLVILALSIIASSLPLAAMDIPMKEINAIKSELAGSREPTARLKSGVFRAIGAELRDRGLSIGDVVEMNYWENDRYSLVVLSLRLPPPAEEGQPEQVSMTVEWLFDRDSRLIHRSVP